MSVGLTQPSQRALDEFRTQYFRVNNPMAAQRLWDRIAPEERELLGGDLSRAFHDGGTEGMWCRLKHVSVDRAVVDLAHWLGFSNSSTRDWLLHEMGEAVDTLPAARGDDQRRHGGGANVPAWNLERRELTFRGVVIREVVRPTQATNVVAVLDAFEAADWPPRINDPLPGGIDQQRVNKTVHSLNAGLSLIRFSADGTGRGFAWRPS